MLCYMPQHATYCPCHIQHNLHRLLALALVHYDGLASQTDVCPKAYRNTAIMYIYLYIYKICVCMYVDINIFTIWLKRPLTDLVMQKAGNVTDCWTLPQIAKPSKWVAFSRSPAICNGIRFKVPTQNKRGYNTMWTNTSILPRLEGEWWTREIDASHGICCPSQFR